MLKALEAEGKSRLDAGQPVEAGWRAAYLILLKGGSVWLEVNRAELATAVRPSGAGEWTIRQVGMAADYYLLSQEVAWNADGLENMLRMVEIDLKSQIDRGDLVMAADRLALHDILAKSLEP
jgi:hypothetical protein